MELEGERPFEDEDLGAGCAVWDGLGVKECGKWFPDQADRTRTYLRIVSPIQWRDGRPHYSAIIEERWRFVNGEWQSMFATGETPAEVRVEMGRIFLAHSEQAYRNALPGWRQYMGDI